MRFPNSRAYHVIYDDSLMDAVKYAAENDWTSIVPDIGVPSFSPERISSGERTRLREASRDLSIGWGFHAPGDDVSLFSTYPSVREGVMQYFKHVINLAREISTGPTNVVIHAGVPPKFKKARNQPGNFSETHQEIYAQTLRENLTELIEHAFPHIKIVLENTGWFPLIRDVVRQLLPTGLKLCLDIPKLYDSGFKIIEEDWNFIQEHKGVIEVVHIHDVDPTLGSHQVVGEGVIDFERFLRFLGELPNKPHYVFEVRPREAAHESLLNIGRLLEVLNLDL
ncbi:MAG: sugar phosphate isomerase/epimerase family protein [Candidatus Thorarchaeota archaeon]